MNEKPMTPEEFWTILHAPVEDKPIFYRLYYIICYFNSELKRVGIGLII